MIFTEGIDKLNEKDEREFNDLSTRIFRSFLLKTSKWQTISKKDQLLSDFISFLNNYLETDFIKSYKEKTNFLNLIDKLTLQKELLKVRKGQLKESDIKEAARRLGKKSQSAFKKK